MFFNGIRPESDKCCGCEGCRAICPKSAITMKEDRDGFIIPEVNTELCIECGLCEKVCPITHVEKVVSPVEGEAYAAVNTNLAELQQSSSGGVFSLIAKHILDKRGFISGASFDSNLSLHHILTDCCEDMSKLRGSKYLQSRIGDIFAEIRNILIKGKPVYFVGTGCQVAALKLFLRKEFDNLYTSDILCHGVPPQKIFDALISGLEKEYNGKVINYNFRDKSVWKWSCSSSSSNLKLGRKIKYIGFNALQDGYFNAFIHGDNYRESCYACPYAQGRRAGDITLGDYWGVENYIKIPNIRSGVSAIIINTVKGKALLESIRNNVSLYPTDMKNIKVINRTLVEPTPRPLERNYFFHRFNNNPIDTLLSYSRLTTKRHMIYMLKRNPYTSSLINFIKKIFNK